MKNTKLLKEFLVVATDLIRQVLEAFRNAAHEPHTFFNLVEVRIEIL